MKLSNQIHNVQIHRFKFYIYKSHPFPILDMITNLEARLQNWITRAFISF